MRKPLLAVTCQRVCLVTLPLTMTFLYTWFFYSRRESLVKDVEYMGLRLKESVVNRLHTSAPEIFALLHDESFIPHAVLRVSEQTATQSCITKPNVALVNGTSPGPEIRLIEGQTSWIRVYNDMHHQNLTMHWHGLSMAVSPFSDGTPAASQWPIPPRHFFDYELGVDVGMAGTYFYHSHIGFQAVSVAGPLVIEDAKRPPYHYDDERIIAISDVFDKTDEDIEKGLLSSPFVWSGETANVLVNGKGQLDGTRTSPDCELASIDVEPDKTYRLRFIGGTALSFVTLAFEDHDELTIIEADGSYTKPHNASYIQIGSGQRFSALLKTKPKKKLKKTQFYMQIETRDRPSMTRSYAILNYAKTPSILSSPSTPPLTLPPTNQDWLELSLRPYTTDPTNPFPPSSSVNRHVVIRTHQLISQGNIVWAQDLFPWMESYPQEPYLVSLYKEDGIEFPSLARALANEGIDPQTRAFPAEIGEVIDIVLQNTGGDNSGGVDIHPFHAHGGHFWDLGGGPGTYDADVNEARLVESAHRLRGGDPPAQRDTTMLFRFEERTAEPGQDAGWRAWRLRVTEPGVWMIHCHILQHMVMGMQTLWVMGNETELLKLSRPDVQGYLEFGGDVYGNETKAPMAVHFKGPW